MGGKYGNYSATEVEYNEAVRLKKRILLYARDRLVADYSVWKKNKKITDLPWVGEEISLVKFYSRVARLHKNYNNFIRSFVSSCDLKDCILKDINKSISEASMELMMRDGRMPMTYVELEDCHISVKENESQVKISVTNLGSTAIMDIFVVTNHHGNDERGFNDLSIIPFILPGGRRNLLHTMKISRKEKKGRSITGLIEVGYSTVFGGRVADIFDFDIEWISNFNGITVIERRAAFQEKKRFIIRQFLFLKTIVWMSELMTMQLIIWLRTLRWIWSSQ